MHIDSHQHFWHYEKSQYPWITDDIPALQRDFLPDALAAIIARHSIDGTVVVQAREDVQENAYLLQLAAENPWILGVVGWIDLAARDAAEQIQECAANPLFKGIRYSRSDLGTGPPDSLRRGMQALAARNLTFDLLVTAATLEGAVQLVQQFPDNQFVLDHIGKPDILAGEMSPWNAHIRELGSRPNVACKVSGLVYRPVHAAISQAGFVRFLDVVFAHFGPDRLMFGSDWPVCTLCKTYAEVLAIVSTYIKALPHTEQQAVMGRTAMRIYRLAP